MLVHLRLQVRVLFEKQRNLTNNLQNSEEKVKNRKEQLLTKDQATVKLWQHITTLKQKINLERVRFDLTLKETKHAAEKEINELKNEMKRAEEEFYDCRRKMMRACSDSRREEMQARQSLEETTKETCAVNDSFRAVYDDYLRLESYLKDIEQEMMPLQLQIYELAKTLNVKPTELLSRIEQLKVVLTSDENIKELLIKAISVMKNDEVSAPKDSETIPTCVDTCLTESFNNPPAGSSSNLKQGDLSCPFSQKFLPEQLNNPGHKGTGKKNEVEKEKVVRPKLPFKISKWQLRQRRILQ